jgi:hypothetical protein
VESTNAHRQAVTIAEIDVPDSGDAFAKAVDGVRQKSAQATTIPHINPYGSFHLDMNIRLPIETELIFS